MNKCECGCQSEVKKAEHRFIHGHNGKGIPRSQNEIELMKKHWASNKKEWCKKIKESWNDERKKGHIAKRKGKLHTEEHCKKISIANSGKIRTDEVRCRISGSLKGRFLGILNPFYRDGSSNKNKTARQTFEYKQWRKNVFERDNFTCQHCGKTKCYVTAHHIKSFAYYPELRYDINNGMTLCEDCHSKTDNYKKRVKKNNSITIKI